MPFTATWMDLEIKILSEVKSDRERQILYDITYMWNIMKMIQSNIYETETNSEISKLNLELPKGKLWGEG